MLRSVILEGFVIGLLASVVGLFLGLGLGKGMNSLFVAAGIDLPQAGTVFATRTIVVSLLVGTIVTCSRASCRRSGQRACLRSPRCARDRRSRVAPRALCPYVAVATIAIAVVALSVGLFANGLGTSNVLLLLGLGVIALFVGVALLASRLVKPLAALLGWPAERLGLGWAACSENAVRHPGRTASTAAALMIGSRS